MAPGGPSPQQRYEVWSPNPPGSDRIESTGIEDEDPYDAIYPEVHDLEAGPSRSQPREPSMSAASASGSTPPRPFPSLLRVTHDPAFSSDPSSNPYYVSHLKEKASSKQKADKKSLENKLGVEPHVTNEDVEDRMEDGDMLGLDPPPAYTPSASTSSTTPSMTSASSLTLSEPHFAITPSHSQSQISVVTDSTSSDLVRIVVSPSTEYRNASGPELQPPVERPVYVGSFSEHDMHMPIPERSHSDEGHGASKRTSPKRKVHPQALDRIDELDVTNPLGITLHNDGPYDAVNRKLVGSVHSIPHHRGRTGKAKDDQMTRGPRHPALQPASYAVGDIVPKGFTGRPLVDEYYDPNAFHVYSGPQNNQPIPRPFTVGVPPHVYPDSMYNAAHSGRVPYPAHYSMPSPSANFDQESVPPVPYHGQQHPMPASRHDGRLHKSPSPPQSLPPNMKPGPHGVISAPSCLPPPGAGYTVSPSPASQRLPLQPLPPERQHLLSPPADTMTPLPSPSLPNPHPEPVAHQHQASYRAPPVPQVPRQPVSNIRHAPPLPEIPLPPRALPHERRPSGQTQNQLLQPRNIPPRPAPHYLPKRLVMPSPLQNRPQQSQPTAAAPRPAAPLYLDKHRPFQPEKKVQFDMHVRAQEIPMHQREPKLVKKRNTIAGAGNNAREERQPEGMHRRGTSWFGGKMTRHATVQEEKGSKFGRKLSKRK